MDHDAGELRFGSLGVERQEEPDRHTAPVSGRAVNESKRLTWFLKQPAPYAGSSSADCAGLGTSGVDITCSVKLRRRLVMAAGGC